MKLIGIASARSAKRRAAPSRAKLLSAAPRRVARAKVAAP